VLPAVFGVKPESLIVTPRVADTTVQVQDAALPTLPE
jgi:hypothetical protein